MPNPPTPAEFYEYYRYPGDVELINATNALVAAYDRYVWELSKTGMKPAPINLWLSAIFTEWEKNR